MLARRHFLGSLSVAAAAAAYARFPAGAAEFAYKFGHDDPTTYSPSIRLAAAVDAINRESNGRLEITVFPDSVLGGSTQMMGQVRVGAIQFLRQISGNIALVAPALGIDGLPYIFANSKQADAARSGPLGGYYRDAVSKIGLYSFIKMWDYGYREVFNSVRPVNVPEDLRNLKVRVPIIKEEVAFFKALGGSPIPLNVNEMYTSLQTHVLDGGELPLAPIYSRKLYEVCKYVSLTNHISTGMLTVANEEAWRKLPRDLQELVERHFEAATVAANNDTHQNDAAMLENLKRNGMVANAANQPAFVAAVRKAGLYTQWKESYGDQAWALLEKTTGKLA